MSSNPLKVSVKYHADITPLTKTKRGDWIDLRAAKTVKMKAGEFKLISLGVSMKLPSGYEAVIVPRSSTFKTWGIIQTNHFGVIDNSYSGTNDIWKFPAYATRDCVIEKDSRICQFRIQERMGNIEFDTVDRLNSKNRGGFGSSGIK